MPHSRVESPRKVKTSDVSVLRGVHYAYNPRVPGQPRTTAITCVAKDRFSAVEHCLGPRIVHEYTVSIRDRQHLVHRFQFYVTRHAFRDINPVLSTRGAFWRGEILVMRIAQRSDRLVNTRPTDDQLLEEVVQWYGSQRMFSFFLHAEDRDADGTPSPPGSQALASDAAHFMPNSRRTFTSESLDVEILLGDDEYDDNDNTDSGGAPTPNASQMHSQVRGSSMFIPSAHRTFTSETLGAEPFLHGSEDSSAVDSGGAPTPNASQMHSQVRGSSMFIPSAHRTFTSETLGAEPFLRGSEDSSAVESDGIPSSTSSQVEMPALGSAAFIPNARRTFTSDSLGAEIFLNSRVGNTAAYLSGAQSPAASQAVETTALSHPLSPSRSHVICNPEILGNGLFFGDSGDGNAGELADVPGAISLQIEAPAVGCTTYKFFNCEPLETRAGGCSSGEDSVGTGGETMAGSEGALRAIIAQVETPAVGSSTFVSARSITPASFLTELPLCSPKNGATAGIDSALGLVAQAEMAAAYATASESDTCYISAIEKNNVETSARNSEYDPARLGEKYAGDFGGSKKPVEVQETAGVHTTAIAPTTGSTSTPSSLDVELPLRNSVEGFPREDTAAGLGDAPSSIAHSLGSTYDPQTYFVPGTRQTFTFTPNIRGDILAQVSGVAPSPPQPCPPSSSEAPTFYMDVDLEQYVGAEKSEPNVGVEHLEQIPQTSSRPVPSRKRRTKRGTAVKTPNVAASKRTQTLRSDMRQREAANSTRTLASTRLNLQRLAAPQSTSVTSPSTIAAHSATQCYYCRQGGYIALCGGCGRGMCYGHDGIPGCLPFDHGTLPIDLRCEQCYNATQSPISYPVPSRSVGAGRSGISGLPLFSYYIALREQGIMTSLSHLKGLVESRQKGSQAEIQACRTMIFGGESTHVDYNKLLEENFRDMASFQLRFQESNLVVTVATHADPADGTLQFCNNKFLKINDVIETVLATAVVQGFSGSTLVLITCGGLVGKAEQALRWASSHFKSVLAFGASAVDPCTVVTKFLDTFFDHHVLGRDSADLAVRRALGPPILSHTDVYLFEQRRLRKYSPASLCNSPNGDPVRCCNAEMKYIAKRSKDGAEYVAFKCTQKSHPVGSTKKRYVHLKPSTVGIVEFYISNGQRFMVASS
ncbi:hypothetical protein BOTBODRAFT_49529 [Botryobasidium botryosum FD-172 SS1]|uniref:Uncharacterized protein n=1 Tax=Botryobasidium botryosum (strain FD-172 SS1) TaxID=930990 RepID=A0A067LSD4_BOTB1|nr:hypothetical protein BOTBODRAFT_49529 [Botryobasidium botryosum FD-172 SS1]